MKKKKNRKKKSGGRFLLYHYRFTKPLRQRVRAGSPRLGRGDVSSVRCLLPCAPPSSHPHRSARAEEFRARFTSWRKMPAREDWLVKPTLVHGRVFPEAACFSSPKNTIAGSCWSRDGITCIQLCLICRRAVGNIAPFPWAEITLHDKTEDAFFLINSHGKCMKS